MNDDPRIEAAARADLPAWSGSRFDDLAHDRYRDWRRRQAALILAAADAVDPVRVDSKRGQTLTRAWLQGLLTGDELDGVRREFALRVLFWLDQDTQQ